MSDKPLYYSYILECSDQSLYTGWTNDIEQRLKKHKAGKASRYTRSRLPVRLLGLWRHESRQQAMQQEARIKRLSRVQKLSFLRESTLENSVLLQ